MDASQQSRETIRQWESISSDQAAAMDPDGGFSKRWLLNDVIFDLLGDIAGRRVLDAGSGQGYLSRMMASRGAEVTSIEPAEPLYRHSVHMEEQLQQGIHLIQTDLTTMVLNQRFDAVVANMVLQSIDDWMSAFSACANALRPGGRLIFSIEHPMVSAAHSEWPSEGCLRIGNYDPRPVARPVATDFHRPISAYLNALGRCGLSFEHMEEPTLPPEALNDPDAPPHAALLQHVPTFAVLSAVKIP